MVSRSRLATTNCTNITMTCRMLNAVFCALGASAHQSVSTVIAGWLWQTGQQSASSSFVLSWLQVDV